MKNGDENEDKTWILEAEVKKCFLFTFLLGAVHRLCISGFWALDFKDDKNCLLLPGNESAPVWPLLAPTFGRQSDYQIRKTVYKRVCVYVGAPFQHQIKHGSPRQQLQGRLCNVCKCQCFSVFSVYPKRVHTVVSVMRSEPKITKQGPSG